MNTMLDAALTYARLGYPVLPLWGKIPAISRENGGHGYKTATTDPAQIREWWLGRYRGANIGIPTGPVSRLYVVEFDPRSGGAEGLALLLERYGPLPETVQVLSGRGDGGAHFWLTSEEDLPSIDEFPNGSDGKPLYRGVEFKGRGHLIVAPPSIHPVSHKPYRFEVVYDLFAGFPVASVPACLRDLALANQKPEYTPRDPSPAKGTRPGDLWAAETTWDEILCPHGAEVYKAGDGIYVEWTRAGKDDGCSATTGFTANDNLKVFTSNWAPFEANGNYTKFEAFALLKHNGDRMAAARALAELGYKVGPAVPDPPTDTTPWPDEEDVPPDAPPVGATTTAPESVDHQTPPDCFPTITTRELLSREPNPVKWQVERVVPVNGSAIVAADSGVGKTWASLDLAIATALEGQEWLWHFPTRQGPVLYIDEQSTVDLLQDRIGKLLYGRDVVLTDMPLHFLVRQGITLSDKAAVTRLSHTLEALSPVLVVVDTLGDLFTGDENSAADVGEFFRIVRQLQNICPAAWWLQHHARKPGMFGSQNSAAQMLRGSTRLRGEVDAHIFITRLDDGRLHFEHEKARYAEAVPSFTAELTDVDDSMGVQFKYQGESQTDKARVSMVRLVITGYLGNHGPMKRKDIIAFCVNEGYPERTVARSLKELVQKGHADTEKRGKDAYYWLVDHEAA